MLPDLQLIENLDHPNPADKRKAVDWARSLLGRQDWVILDTETTGLDDTAEVIQIAVLSADNEVLLDTYVRPLHITSIPAESAKIHGITMEMLAAAPSMPELMPRLKELLSSQLVVTYNVKYDARLLRQTIAKNGDGGSPFAISFDCAMNWYSRYAGDWSQSKQDYKFQKLPAGDHSALGDCRATLAMIRKMSNCQDFIEQPVKTASNKKLAALVQSRSALLTEEKQSLQNRLFILQRVGLGAAMLCGFIALIALVNMLTLQNAHNENTPPKDENQLATPLASANGPCAVTGSSNAWMPVSLPHDLKATFITTVRDAGTIDYEFQLAGPVTLLKAIFAQSHGKIGLSLLDVKKTPIATVAVRELLEDQKGNLIARGSFACPAADYGRSDTWRVRLSGFEQNNIVATDKSDLPASFNPNSSGSSAWVPQVAPDRVKHIFPPPGNLPFQPPADQRSDSNWQTQSPPADKNSSAPANTDDFLGGIPQESSNRLSRLETEIYGAPTEFGLNIPERLDRLEVEIFKEKYRSRSVADRLNHLDQSVFNKQD